MGSSVRPPVRYLHRKSEKGATEDEEELSLIELATWMALGSSSG